jgi:EcsC protein family
MMLLLFPSRRDRYKEIRDAFNAAILLKFVTQVAARFGLVITQKVAVQALPIVGALGGAAVNYAFIEHFQDIARVHFTVRRLERIYGKERIRSEYDLITRQP